MINLNLRQIRFGSENQSEQKDMTSKVETIAFKDRKLSKQKIIGSSVSLLKVSVYTVVIVCALTLASHATLEQQLVKAEGMVGGTFAKILLTGAAVIGGVTSAIKGQLMMTLAIVASCALIGLLLTMIKDGSIFNVL